MVLLALLVAQAASNGSDAAIAKRLLPHSARFGGEIPDMAAVGKAIGPATVVGLGEATHGSHEIFEAKRRLFQYLVEKKGFRVLALESNMTQSLPLTRFAATGEGTAADALHAQGFWTWEVAEMERMFQWIRDYNRKRKPTDRVRVVGVDMQESSGTWMALAAEWKTAGLKHAAIDDPAWLSQKRYAGAVDEIVGTAKELSQKAAPALNARYGGDAAPLLEHMAELVRQSLRHGELINMQEDRYEKQEIAARLPEIAKKAASLLDGSSDWTPEAKYGLTLLADRAPGGVNDEAPIKAAANALRQKGEATQEMAEALDFLAIVIALNRENAFTYRDLCMAENVGWIQRSFMPDAKVAVWAHNSHVADLERPGPIRTMGFHLRKRLGTAYYPLGFAFDRGGVRAVGASSNGPRAWDVTAAKPGSIEATLRDVRPGAYFLPFDGLPTELRTWLDVPRPMRAIGAEYSPSTPDRYYETLPAGKIYRGLIFLPQLTPAQGLARPATLE